MHTFDSCRSFGSPSSFSILCVSMHVKEQFSSRIKNNAQNRAKKKVKAQIWKAKKTQLNDAQCTSFFLVRFISATQFTSPFPAIITDWSQMPGSLVCPFFIFRCFRPEWSSICIVDIFFLLFGLVWFASQKSQCVFVCVFFWQAALRNGIRRNWTSTFTMQQLQTEEEKNVVRCKSTSYTN